MLQDTLCTFNYTYTADDTPRITGFSPAVVSAIGAHTTSTLQNVINRYNQIGTISIETSYVNEAVGTSLSAWYGDVSTTATVISNDNIKSQILQLPSAFISAAYPEGVSIRISYGSEEQLEVVMPVSPLPVLQSILCDQAVCTGVSGKKLAMTVTLENVPSGFLGDKHSLSLCR